MRFYDHLALIDENNGIFLDAKYVDSTLYSMFEVEDNLLTSTLRFHEHYLDFEITFSNKNNSRSSGKADTETPKVISFPITIVQEARLYLIDN